MKGYKLEYTKKAEDGAVFYRYRYCDCRFWFSQTVAGKIWAVHIENETYPDIEFYADDREEEGYPRKIRFRIPSAEIASDIDYERFNKMLCHLGSVRDGIQYFFEKSEHAKLYYNNHKEKDE